MTRTPIRDLSPGAIGYAPAPYYYLDQPYGDAWDFSEAIQCEECSGIVVAHGPEINTPHWDWLNHGDCEGAICAEGPMMSYFYALPDDPVDVEIARLWHLPVCVVRIDGCDDPGLALTGGGMDLSWEICEAYMILGHLPPLHFAGDLPAMAGRGETERDRWILDGCKESLRVASARATHALRTLQHRFPEGV